MARFRQPGAPGVTGNGLGRSLLALVVRPWLWSSAARLVPSGWWQRWPPRPWPPTDYIRFRTQTMYGESGRLDPDDLVTYLEWCRRMGHPTR
jgi:hypothetical protein